MGEQNYLNTFVLHNSSPVEDETDKCPDYSSIIKEEKKTFQNIDNNYQLYHVEGNVINTSDIAFENSNVDTINVLEIQTEIDDRNKIIQNIKEDIDVKEEILTYVNNVNNNETYTENVVVNNNKSNNITVTSTNTNSSLLCSINEKNTTFQNNYNNNPSYHIENVCTKIEQMSPECSDTFTQNVFKIKTKIDNSPNNFETSMNVLKSCNKDVNDHNNIQLKSSTSSDKKQYKCNICKKLFVYQGDLRCHLFTHSNKCDICQKSFIHKSYLNEHMLIHTGEKPFKCDFCQKLFINRPALKLHTYIHTGEKPHKCDICQKSFSKNRALKFHIYTHTGEKPFKCDICHKSFIQKRQIKIHILAHLGEKPYKCDICLKKFTGKYSLNEHMLLHTGEKPYKCDICHKSFAHKVSLHRHKRNICPEFKQSRIIVFSKKNFKRS